MPTLSLAYAYLGAVHTGVVNDLLPWPRANYSLSVLRLRLHYLSLANRRAFPADLLLLETLVGETL